MPSKEDKVVKNVDFDEIEEKKMKKIREEKEDEVDEEEVDEEEEEEDDDNSDDEEEEDDDEEDFADGLTDIGLYNVLGNFLVDEDGNNIGTSLSNIAKELAKLNHLVKKYVNKS